MTGTTKIKAFGIVRWVVYDVDGTARLLRVPAYYIPDSDIHLMSPQSYGQFHGWNSRVDDNLGGNNFRMWLLLNVEDSTAVSKLEIPISTFDNLPHFRATPPSCERISPEAPACENKHCPNCQVHAFNMEVLSNENQNLTKPHKELLLDHQRLGHINMQTIKRLYQDREVVCEFDGCENQRGTCLTPRHLGCASCLIPKCFACQAAKMWRRPTGATHKKSDPERKDILSANSLSPGDLVYVNQYESSIRGRLPHTYGKEKQSSMYCGGTIFVDVASGTVHLYHQVSLAAADTLLSKAQFEHEAQTHGIHIKKYHTDNGIFVSEAWKEHLHGLQQTQRLSGTGAHHQNAVAECVIQTVTTSARAMLLHLKVHWLDEYDTRLWPFALQYAAWLYNYTPKSNNLAPIEIFTCQLMNCEFLRCAKVFGCPVYVLKPRLQDGKKIPKWEPCARRP
jgi:hypothetical protein